MFPKFDFKCKKKVYLRHFFNKKNKKIIQVNNNGKPITTDTAQINSVIVYKTNIRRSISFEIFKIEIPKIQINVYKNNCL